MYASALWLFYIITTFEKTFIVKPFLMIFQSNLNVLGHQTVILKLIHNVIDLYRAVIAKNVPKAPPSLGYSFNPNVMNVDSLTCHSNIALMVLALCNIRWTSLTLDICANWGLKRVQYSIDCAKPTMRKHIKTKNNY